MVQGRHERGFLYAAIKGIVDMKSWVKLDDLAVPQLWWWVVNLRVVHTGELAWQTPSNKMWLMHLFCTQTQHGEGVTSGRERGAIALRKVRW